MLALVCIKTVQRFGVNIGTLSSYEQSILNNGNCNIYSIPFRIEKNLPLFTDNKKYLLVYLGRPLKQKGWFKYLELCKGVKEQCLAIIPWCCGNGLPPNIEVMINPAPELIAKKLSMASIMILPSDYESFGFAQAEALIQGCCVPVFGMWPIWLDVEELDWRNLDTTECLNKINNLKANP
ncbi:MAG: glycosyltransferase family 1 protein, partial [Alphaproteobacteria bacterium]|nr:glycosyltransferase family 1 protein [Alphaproteobacteria bacterium]